MKKWVWKCKKRGDKDKSVFDDIHQRKSRKKKTQKKKQNGIKAERKRNVTETEWF